MMMRDRGLAAVAVGPRGFTLIELLVTITIIAVLVGLTAAAGVAVLRKGRVSTTQNILQTLDRVLDEAMSARGGAIPPYKPDAYDMVPGPLNELEKYRGRMHMRRPDAAVFLKQAKGFGAVDTIVKQIEDTYLSVTFGDDYGAAGPSTVEGQDLTPSVLDVWRREVWEAADSKLWPIEGQQVIYYVHPDNDFAQDLYGRCQNGRPYFMSAGPDEIYGTGERISGESNDEFKERMLEGLEDNIYSYDGVKGTHRLGMGSDREVFN